MFSFYLRSKDPAIAQINIYRAKELRNKRKVKPDLIVRVDSYYLFTIAGKIYTDNLDSCTKGHGRGITVNNYHYLPLVELLYAASLISKKQYETEVAFVTRHKEEEKRTSNLSMFQLYAERCGISLTPAQLKKCGVKK